MLRPISDERRRTLLQISACVCGGALSLLFITGSPSFTAQAEQLTPGVAVRIPSVPDRLTFSSVDIGHDPFIPRVVLASELTGAPTVASTAKPDDIGIVLPPNAGASGTPVGPASRSGLPIVRAVVIGQSARALVEANASVEVMQVGDALGTSTISAIDASGVTLASGTHLPLAKDAQ